MLRKSRNTIFYCLHSSHEPRKLVLAAYNSVLADMMLCALTKTDVPDIRNVQVSEAGDCETK